MSELGLFGKPAFVAIHEPYVDRHRTQDFKKSQVRNVLVTTAKRGVPAPTPPRLFEGEPWQEAHRALRKAKRAQTAPRPGQRPFLQASPAKKQACRGDFNGSFTRPPASEEAEAGPPAAPPAARRKFEAHQPKNFLTSPAKKGGPGFPGIVLSQPEYVSTPYESSFDHLKADSRRSRAKRWTPVPYYPSPAAPRYFHSSGGCVDAPGVIAGDGAPGAAASSPPLPPAPAPARSRGTAAEAAEARPPFRPSSPGKHGPTRFFSPAKYSHDPYRPPLTQVPRPASSVHPERPFRPSTPGHAYAVRSLLDLPRVARLSASNGSGAVTGSAGKSSGQS